MSNPKDSPVKGGAKELNQGSGEPGFIRSEPLLDVKRFKEEYLFGIPLVSALTQEKVSNNTLKSFIRKGISDFETSVRIPVNPVRSTDWFDFERADDLQFGTRRLNRWPLLQVENLYAVLPGRSEDQGTDYPTDWVCPDGDTGLIRITPISSSLTNADAQFISSTGFKALAMGTMKSWPKLWRITYTAGFDHDKVPAIVNDLIGIMSAIKFLSQMGPVLFPVNSISIGIDGMSQSTGNAGPQFLAQRMQELQAERERLIPQLKSYFGTDIIMTVW